MPPPLAGLFGFLKTNQDSLELAWKIVSGVAIGLWALVVFVWGKRSKSAPAAKGAQHSTAGPEAPAVSPISRDDARKVLRFVVLTPGRLLRGAVYGALTTALQVAAASFWFFVFILAMTAAASKGNGSAVAWVLLIGLMIIVVASYGAAITHATAYVAQDSADDEVVRTLAGALSGIVLITPGAISLST